MAKRFGGPINLYHTVDCQCKPCTDDRRNADALVWEAALEQNWTDREIAQSDADDISYQEVN